MSIRIPQAPARPPGAALHDAALMVLCPMCWASPGTVCQRHPAGCHVARYAHAVNKGQLTAGELAAVLDGLDVITSWTVIPAVAS